MASQLKNRVVIMWLMVVGVSSDHIVVKVQT